MRYGQSVKVELVTTSRRDLFDISDAFARAIGTDFLADPQSPLVVAVRGSEKSGKRIVTDVIKSRLFSSGSILSYRGSPGHDEGWMGTREGREIELTYIDLAWSGGYSLSALNTWDHEAKEAVFLKQRGLGGISVLQNRSSARPGDIDIWIESREYFPVGADPRRVYTSRMREAYAEAHNRGFFRQGSRKWARYVEVQLNNTSLALTPGMIAAVKALGAGAAAVSEALKGKKIRLPHRPYKSNQPDMMAR